MIQNKKGFRNLVVWQKAHTLVLEIYVETKNFPKEELYGITSQLRRAALSVPTNIAEGTGRLGMNEMRRFSGIALGSLVETEYLLELSLNLGYFDLSTYKRLENLRNEVGGLLWKFNQSLN